MKKILVVLIVLFMISISCSACIKEEKNEISEVMNEVESDIYDDTVENYITENDEDVNKSASIEEKSINDYAWIEFDEENNTLNIELQEIEKKSKELELKLQEEAVTQLDMNMMSKDIYVLWDNELNDLWKRLNAKLNEKEKKDLLTEERKWINDKEKAVKAEGEKYGGSIRPLVENGKTKEITRERCYVLAKYLGEKIGEEVIDPPKFDDDSEDY